jgi:hypothetical protein
LGATSDVLPTIEPADQVVRLPQMPTSEAPSSEAPSIMGEVPPQKPS